MNYCVIDFETTGLTPQGSEVIEFAAVRVQNSEIGLSFASLCRPNNSSISRTITRITGITPDMVAAYPVFEDLLPSLLEFIGEDTIVGHNVSFDIKFLDHYCRQTGYERVASTLCTLKLARKLYPHLPSKKLEAVASYLGIRSDGYHRALADAMATAKILIAMQNSGGFEVVKPIKTGKISHVPPAKPEPSKELETPRIADLDTDTQQRFATLKSWRAEVARANNLLAFMIFHDSTLTAIAARAPKTLDDLRSIRGIGTVKLEKYGVDVLRITGLDSASTCKNSVSAMPKPSREIETPPWQPEVPTEEIFVQPVAPGEKLKSIARIDQASKRTHGWYVRVRFLGKTHAKFFSDRQCGSRENSLETAIKWRDKTEQNLGKVPPWSQFPTLAQAWLASTSTTS